MSDNLPTWAMEKAREAIAEQHSHESLSQVVARALVAERERAAKTAETLILSGKGKAQSVAHAAGHHIAAAIRKGE